MHIITRKRLNDFAAEHPYAASALQQWYARMKKASIASFAELRAEFPSADQVGKLTVFNIGGNTARLIAAIHYNRRKVYIRAVLTHDEYNKDKWKGKAMTASELERVEHVWPDVAPMLFAPHSESEYQRLVALLDELIDRVGEDETHPLASLMEVVGALIERYEEEHVPELSAEG